MEKNDIKKSVIETWTYEDGILINHEIEEKELKWIPLVNDPVYQKMLENIGIGSIHPMYIEVNEIQDKEDEYKKITKFLKKYIEYYASLNGKDASSYEIKFINYGKTELVYVLTDNEEKRITLLVKQPKVKYGLVKEEYLNLLKLKEKDENVVAPFQYYTLGDQELYATPYINQARCVASYGSWGMYIPEPIYRFESFTIEQEKIVNACMIAKLVSLYDFENNEGIAKAKLGGGDFMLPKDWENEIPTYEATLNSLYLIAARQMIKCSFDDYLQIIRDEFTRATILEKEENLIINVRGRVPMNSEDIEKGIELGKALINGRKRERKC